MLTQRFSLKLQQAGSEPYRWRRPELSSVHTIVQEQPSRKALIIPLPSITCAMNAGRILKVQLCRRYRRTATAQHLLEVPPSSKFHLKSKSCCLECRTPHFITESHSSPLLKTQGHPSAQYYDSPIFVPPAIPWSIDYAFNIKSCQTALWYFPFLSCKLLPSF